METTTHTKCGICHTRFETEDARTSCPECGLAFHADCWTENWGCSAYGCSQVNALNPRIEPELVATEIGTETRDSFPWEFLLLAGNVFCLIFGVLAFGIPSICLALVTALVGWRHPIRRRGILAASGVVAVVGLVAGLQISWFVWMHR
jgi:hypothetical protein